MVTTRGFVHGEPVEASEGVEADGSPLRLRGAAGSTIQKVYGENQERPTVFVQAAPGGLFQTILVVNITTTTGDALDISANLSALTDGGAGSTEIEATIKLNVDGVDTGLGDTETVLNDEANLEPFVALSLLARVPVLPGAHVVRLQWTVQGDGGADKSIGFLSADQDGCAMFVEEVRA